MKTTTKVIAALSVAAALFVGGANSTAAPAPTCFGERATIVGTEGDDAIAGTRDDDVIVALGGNDLVSAHDGDDLVCAGAATTGSTAATLRSRSPGTPTRRDPSRST